MVSSGPLLLEGSSAGLLGERDTGRGGMKKESSYNCLNTHINIHKSGIYDICLALALSHSLHLPPVSTSPNIPALDPSQKDRGPLL